MIPRALICDSKSTGDGARQKSDCRSGRGIGGDDKWANEYWSREKNFEGIFKRFVFGIIRESVAN